MTIKPGFGIGELLFGMKQQDVTALLGQPDRHFEDEEGNMITLYHSFKLRLTFYEDEDLRLGYVICSHPDVLLHGLKVIGQRSEQVMSVLQAKGMRSWEREFIDAAEHHLDPDSWVTLISEFGSISKVECGALIERDEFVWRFPEKTSKKKK